ncbi:uncharacterized protein LOC130994901 [Salvia miltiorrhiza]|uniref:uncharacterized protein LOC130994901 n=1 Tax=Salvia miltiorrhiza TaxID=226208 RepID=UPI0025AD878C|nr:uncharacterized protein LOC130994901 [Salvia miltiorrhiza]XP_057776013.1 uncharacterized protein LOC130994901 [Salvia miltiorrhiza]XP_057776014.1 uncharacterized protein LOC130994901 [Salvia miltiorrhiza]
MPTNIGSLPTDLLFEILLRLPADHLYERVRLVCRRWYHIIHSHAFINAQMHGATCGLLLSPLNDNNTLPLYVTADADGGIHTSELNHISKLGVLATCNGLVLELDDRRFPRLVNPTTKQSFLLPRGVSYAVVEYGFAYSAASLVCKVIAQHNVFHSPPRLQIDYGLDVLTVGVDESWRKVEDVYHLPDYVKRFFFNKAPLTSEGFLHWGRGRYCATFDVETENITLSEVPLPHQAYLERDYFYLSTGRCLSLLVACGDLSWEVWEMKSETGEWRKALPNVELGAEKCRIQQFSDRALEPLGWVKYPQVLALYFGAYYSEKQCRHCIFYNLDTHQLDSIELPHSYSRDYDAFPHKNNLIWLS